MRAAAAILVTLLLGGCAADNTLTEQPAMYVNMATAGARLDPLAAASMISQYRQNNGLGGVAIDQELMKLAESQSQAMASKNKLDHDVRAPLPRRLSEAGYPASLRGRKRVGRLSHLGRSFFRLARLAAAPGKYAEKRCHKNGHRGELCSEYQIQGILDAHFGVNRGAMTSA